MVAVEVVLGESPGEMPVQVQGVSYLVEGIGDGRVVGVVAVRADGCTFVVVHVLLDARDGAAVPAPVMYVNDWMKTSSGEQWPCRRAFRIEQGPRIGDARPQFDVG